MKKRCSAMLAALCCLIFFFLPRHPAEQASGKPGGVLIWIELDRKRLTVYENGQEAAVFPIASGARDTPSPVGVFRVNRRFSTEMSGFGTRFLGLDVGWGQYGIHGTNAPSSIGLNASHGCIRMRVKDAEKLYAMIPIGAKVILEGGPFGPFSMGLRTLREGDRGADVMELQKRLILHGFLQGRADGVFGSGTRQAVIGARKAFSLPAGDQADETLLNRLGILLFE